MMGLLKILMRQENEVSIERLENRKTRCKHYFIQNEKRIRLGFRNTSNIKTWHFGISIQIHFFEIFS